MIANFARTKYQWLDQVAADAALNPLAFKVAYRIAAYVNQETGEAWPSQARLAEECNVSRSGLRKTVRALVDGGHLDVASGAGRVHTSRYRWILPAPEKGYQRDTFTSENVSPQGHVNAENLSPQEHVSQQLNVSPEKHVSDGNVSPQGHPSCHPSDTQRVPPVTTINLNEQLEGTIPVFSKQAAEAAGSRLDENSKDVLFKEGVAWLVEKTGRSIPSIKSSIGQMLKDARDDAGVVLAILRETRRQDKAEPVSWIIGCIKARYPPRTVAANSIPSNFKLSKPAVRA